MEEEKEKISPIFMKRNKEVSLYWSVQALQRAVQVCNDMESGVLPVSEQTKKAMQTAIKEICIALSDSI